MQLIVERFNPAGSYQGGVLHEMYESPELYNEGVVSFQYPLLVASDEEMEQFLGKVFSDVGHAVGSAAKGIGSAVSAIDKVVPVSLLTSTLAAPLKAGIGAVQAAAEGRNVFQGAIRSLVPDIGTRFLVDTAAGVAGGKNILKAAEAGMKAGIGDVKKSLQFAAMVAPFVPGIGTGVGAALGAANALANGEPITEALISAARSAVPGGQIAQMAFDVGAKLVQGKKLTDALLEEARAKLPGGPFAKAAFDVGLSIVQGKNLQQAALKATGQLLPKSPFAENAMNFVNKVASGQNLQQAALSQVGNLVYKKVLQQTGPLRLPGIGAAKSGLLSAARSGLQGVLAAQSAANAAKAAIRRSAAAKAAQARSRIKGALLKAPLSRTGQSPATAMAGSPYGTKISVAAAAPAVVSPVPAPTTVSFGGRGGGEAGQRDFNIYASDRVAPPWQTVAGSNASVPDQSSYSSPDRIVQSGKMPVSGHWHKKRNGQLLVVGVSA
jgi:hypothetical protein